MTITNPTLLIQPRQMVFVGLLILGATLLSQSAQSEPQHDLLFFLSVEGFENLSDSTPAMNDSYLRPVSDVLYAYNNERFRFLGEYIWSSTESELERFKVGWQANAQTMIWVGRFHTTAKFWTTEYHHGQYMQTSISRPGLEEWEDESGPMPSHITGLAIEHEIARNDQSVIQFGFAAGLGSTFEGEELVPYDVFDSNSDHNLSVNYRMAYRPDALSDNQIGLILGWNDIPVRADSHPNLTGLTEIKQSTAGLFADWRINNWRLLASWVYFDNEVKSDSAVVADDYAIAYLQGEYKVSSDWTLFGRTEISSGEDNSPYLRLLPAFIAHRHMLGARWDFVDSQSIAVELADTSTQGSNRQHNNFKELRFQWSAVFP